MYRLPDPNNSDQQIRKVYFADRKFRHLLGTHFGFDWRLVFVQARSEDKEMNKVMELENTDKQPSSSVEGAHNCMELLKMARIHRERGQKQESEQFYAALVQVLRPDTAVSELQI